MHLKKNSIFDLFCRKFNTNWSKTIICTIQSFGTQKSFYLKIFDFLVLILIKNSIQFSIKHTDKSMLTGGRSSKRLNST